MPARCFVAIDLPQGTLAPLAEAKLAFLLRAGRWAGEKWVRPDLLHVTLSFVGPMPDAAVDDLLAALEETLASTGRFDLRLDGVRAMPSPRRATMLWATLAGDATACGRLHDTVEEAVTGRLGLEPDARAFTPHLTLVRSRRPRRVPLDALEAASEALSEAGKGPDGFVSVRSVTVYASILGPGGPSYDVLGTVPLGEA